MLLFCDWIYCKIVAFENPDVHNHPQISSRIFAIIRSFGGRDGSEKIDVRRGTIKKRHHIEWKSNWIQYEFLVEKKLNLSINFAWVLNRPVFIKK